MLNEESSSGIDIGIWKPENHVASNTRGLSMTNYPQPGQRNATASASRSIPLIQLHHGETFPSNYLLKSERKAWYWTFDYLKH